MLRFAPRLRQALLFLLVGVAFPAAAHELRPALAEISFPEDGARWRIVFQQLNMEALVADIGPEHENTDDSIRRPLYERLRAMPPGELRAEFDRFAPRFLSGLRVMAGETRLEPEIESVLIPPVGDLALARDSVVTVGGPLPPGTEALTFSWDPRFGSVVLRTVETGEGAYTGYLTGGAASEPIRVKGPTAQGAGEAFLQYLVVGYEHILPLGLDHILFVVGLFLLSTRLRPLLIQITSFTLAHTVTLALGALGWVNLPAIVVEPLIAASIVYVAVENVFTDHLSRFRPVLVVMFGLLHGLGFAGVLMEIGLAAGQFFTSLIAFNLGVEFGQITVIGLCFALVGWFGRKAWYHDQITAPVSLAIAAQASCWVIERAGGVELGAYGRLAALVLLFALAWTLRERPKGSRLWAQVAIAAAALALFYRIDLALA